MSHFPEIKKNFGFGCMRLPLLEDGEVDTAEFSAMVDAFIDAGFNYFDTAHMYVKGKSEPALKTCLTSRHAREEYLLADKLSFNYFEKEEDIRPFFESQLALCGVEYFDFYLMHAQNARYYKKYKECHAYETALELKKEGKIRHVGLSFHDTAEVLDMILTENPEMEFVQIQFNYLDYDDVTVQSRKCLDVCNKHGKPVWIMEPVKGGSLINLPEAGTALWNTIGTGSNASYAIRFAASAPGVEMVLSSMSNMAQMNDNVSFMKDFVPFSEKEYEIADQVREMIRMQALVACTACRYCTDGCPKKIAIPDMFQCLNAKKQGTATDPEKDYIALTENGGKASDCIRCGACEKACPQKLKIRTLLAEVAKAFE